MTPPPDGTAITTLTVSVAPGTADGYRKLDVVSKNDAATYPPVGAGVNVYHHGLSVGCETPSFAYSDKCTVHSVDGFAGSVQMTCKAAADVTCQMSPATVTLTAGGSAESTLTFEITQAPGQPYTDSYRIDVFANGSGASASTYIIYKLMPAMPPTPR